MWYLHIGRSRRHEDVEVYEFEEKPERNQRGDEIEWFGVSGGEEIAIEYNASDVFFSVAMEITDEEREAGGLIVKETPFFDNG